MDMRSATARMGTVLVVLAAGVFGSASSRGAGSGGALPAAAAAPAAVAEDTGCDTTKSLSPAKQAGQRIEEIRKRGTLVVGIDQNSYNWGFRDSISGEIKGFDIDLARAIAASVLGDPNKITLKAVPTARRIDVIKAREVDMIVRTMTITCERMKDVAFSSPYFRVSQSLVVPQAVKVGTVAEGLRGKRVCAADNSSSETELASGRHATAEVRIVDNQLDCLVLMQLGKIDATLADTVLAYAQAAQDPMVHVQGEPIVPAFMGVAMNQADTDLVAWVNQVLVDYRSSGEWLKAYDRWLAPTMKQPDQWLP